MRRVALRARHARRESLAYPCLCLFMCILPSGRHLMLIAVMLACACLGVFADRGDFDLGARGITPFLGALACVVAVQSAIYCLGEFSGVLDLSSAIKEIIRCAVYAMVGGLSCMLPVSRVRHRNVWRTILLATVVVAVLQYLKVPGVNDAITSFYGESVQAYNLENDDLSSFRSGSIFVNPNVCGSFLVCFLSVYLQSLRMEGEGPLWRFATLAAVVTGTVLTGSRTTFLLAIVVILINNDVLIAPGSNRYSAVKALLVIFLVVCGLLVLTAPGASSSSDMRMLRFSEGFADSLSIKFGNLSSLYARGNVQNYLFGFGVFNYSLDSNLLMDCDFGYFTAYFGAMGLALYTFLISRFAGRRFAGPCLVRFGASLVSLMFLFGLTSGLFFNIRFFSTLLIMTLPGCLRGDDAGTGEFVGMRHG